jgi:hypothetical protein
MACAYITDLAKSIYEEIGSPSSLSVSFIQSKLVSNSFVGEVNTLTAECHTVINGDIVPALSIDEQAIYKALYLYQYYTAEGPRAMSAFATKNYVTSVREGDSSISFASPQQLLQAYRGLAQDMRKRVESLSDYYKRNESSPKSVDYFTINQNQNTSFNDGRNLN